MKKEDKRFTRKQAERIIADAAERQDRDKHSGLEAGEGLTYSQIVKSAEEAGIESKYLERSTKDMIAESGGLEKAAMKKTFGTLYKALDGTLSTLFSPVTTSRKITNWLEHKDPSSGLIIGGVGWLAGNGMIATSLPKEYAGEYAAAVFGLSLINGVYEIYRYQKNKLIEEKNGEDKKEPGVVEKL